MAVTATRLFLVCMLLASCANATELVVQKRISVSRALEGKILVSGTEEPADGMTVDLCTPDWKNVIISTKTDKKGHFCTGPGRECEALLSPRVRATHEYLPTQSSH